MSIGENLKNSFYKAKDVAGNVVENVEDVASEAFTKAKDVAGDIVDKVEGTASESFNKARVIAGDAKDAAVDKAQVVADAVTDKVDDMRRTGEQPLADVEERVVGESDNS